MPFMPRALKIAPFLVLSAAVFAQTGFVPPNPISPPTVTPPSLTPVPALAPPVVAAPTLSPETATGSTTPTTATTATTSKGAAAKNAASGSDGSKSASSTAATASALSMLGLGSNNSLLKALSGSDSGESGSDALSGLLGSSSSSTDSATLKKVLDLLEKQQAGNAGSAGTSGTVDAAGATVVPKQSITSGGEIIRFTVNGSDIAASTTTLVSSIIAKDGSFLLTGDRRYLVSRATRTETYYLLCRKNGDGSYRLHADVTQDSKNEYSFLYRLSRRGPLKGAMTGDLLVFRTVDPDFRLDLVIRVIVPSVSKKSIR